MSKRRLFTVWAWGLLLNAVPGHQPKAATLISLPIVWFMVPYDGRLVLVAGKAFALLFEGGVDFISNRPARLFAKGAFGFSAFANLTSLSTAWGALKMLDLLFA